MRTARRADDGGEIVDRILRLDDGALVAIGRSNGPSFDMIIAWSSTDSDGIVWSNPEIIAGGPGNQFAKTIEVVADHLLVGGFADQRAIIWQIAE